MFFFACFFMWQPVKILNVCNTLKQNFWKKKTVFEKLENSFLVKSAKIVNTFPYKTVISEAKKPILRQTEWWLRNGSVTKNGVLPVTTLFVFSKHCFSLRTAYKELICCATNPNPHICTFCKPWSFIWRCFFLVRMCFWHYTKFNFRLLKSWWKFQNWHSRPC